MEKILLKKVKKFKKNGYKITLEEILVQMTPLIKKYAKKSFFMEYDDAIQEYSITIIEAIFRIQTYDNEGQCLSYINECVKNKFCHLCMNYYSKKSKEMLYEDFQSQAQVKENYTDLIFYIDVMHYIKDLCKDSKMKEEIAFQSLIKSRSDSEISKMLHISRQYANRIKREIFNDIKLKYIMRLFL